MDYTSNLMLTFFVVGNSFMELLTTAGHHYSTLTGRPLAEDLTTSSSLQLHEMEPMYRPPNQPRLEQVGFFRRLTFKIRPPDWYWLIFCTLFNYFWFLFFAYFIIVQHFPNDFRFQCPRLPVFDGRIARWDQSSIIYRFSYRMMASHVVMYKIEVTIS